MCNEEFSLASAIESMLFLMSVMLVLAHPHALLCIGPSLNVTSSEKPSLTLRVITSFSFTHSCFKLSYFAGPEGFMIPVGCLLRERRWFSGQELVSHSLSWFSSFTSLLIPRTHPPRIALVTCLQYVPHLHP